MAVVQTLTPGSCDGALQRALEELRSQRFLARLWTQDTSLWSADPVVQAAIRERLGWLTIPTVMATRVAALHTFARELRASGMTRVALLGMGGSALFAEVCRRMFGVADGALDLHVLDSSDPSAIARVRDRGPLEQLAILVSSKSGSTIEVTSLAACFVDAFQRRSLPLSTHGITITDAGTPLEQYAADQRFHRAFVHGPGTGSEVGGRFSALTYFGLVPAVLIGMDAARLLQRAEEAFASARSDAPHRDTAAQLGCLLGAASRQGRDKLTLLCAPGLEPFGAWVEQLIAESTGKEGRGIWPVVDEPRQSPDAYGKDRVFIELQWVNRPDRALTDLASALAKAGHPVVRLAWEDPYDLGGEVVRWSIASVIAGGVLGINPFDEPNVQESKQQTRTLLDRYARTHQLEAGGAQTLVCSDADQPDGAAALRLRGFLAQARPGDGVVLLSFLPRGEAVDRAVSQWRERLGALTGRPTLYGIGPRYLHSTGQLFKGGPDRAIFLLLTADETDDLPIPGQPYTFGVLKRAQALGDVEAMRQHGRRILHVHVQGRIESALCCLAKGR